MTASPNDDLTGPHRPDGPPDVGWERLTEAELRVVHLVASGATNRDAAHALCLSPHTVSSHLRSAFMKLGLHTRTQLAWLAFQVDGHSAQSS
jgi:DNA-binding CsgD family transcriptional regulator